MENIRRSLEVQGYTMRDLVNGTVMLADISEWAAFNEVCNTFFSGKYPARSALGVNGLVLRARVEVECIATVCLTGNPYRAVPELRCIGNWESNGT